VSRPEPAGTGGSEGTRDESTEPFAGTGLGAPHAGKSADVTSAAGGATGVDVRVAANGSIEVADDVAGRLVIAMARLVRRLRRGDPTPLGPGSISALSTIVSEGPMRVGDLAAFEGVRAPTMTRIVDLLVTEGDAERIPDAADGRACLVRATEAGSRAVLGARTARSGLLIERLRRLEPDAYAALVAALPALEALCVDGPETPDRPQ
jgi:DNA-binding MarR family transcriptional regulator